MQYYAVQVKSKTEDKFVSMLLKKNPDFKMNIYSPKRQIDIRRRGKITKKNMAVFPGYVFIEADKTEDLYENQQFVRRTPGFNRFLKSNKEITPLSNRDLELVMHFIKNFGPIAGKSRVYFNENSRIVVVDGPLSGLEGRIIKVDKRKCRAKIKLDIYQDSFSIDLAFEVISSLEGGR